MEFPHESNLKGIESPDSTTPGSTPSSWDAESARSSPAAQGGFFTRMIDNFKPAPIPKAQEGLTEEELRIYMTEHTPLKRGLKARHLSMLAIGGAIGSGLFINSGNSFASGGPAGVIISFALVGSILFAVMQCLGELCVRFPVQGSFYIFAQRFMDESWGFALGWNYVLQWITTVPLELIATATVLDYWDTDNNGATNVNKAAWIALFFSVILFINVFSVKGYGETEFIFSIIKVAAVLGFSIFGIIAICGKAGDQHFYGAQYWHNPGPFAGGFKGVCSVFVNAAFAFSGSEMAGLAAGETENPARDLPRAIKQVFWRIMLFYVGSLLIVSFLVPYNNDAFGVYSDGRSSPFVIAIRDTGVKALPSIFNTVILLSALSVANTSVYGTSRVLTALACEGQAPKIFAFVDREGRPMASIIVTMVVGLLGFLVASSSYNEVFDWLVAFSGLSVILTYLSICWCHLRFRRGMTKQGVPLDELVFKASGGLFSAWYGLIGCVVILAVQFWVAIWPLGEAPNAESFFEVWLGLPIVLACYFGHKLWYKTSWYIKSEDMDLYGGVRSEQLEQQLEEARIWKEENAKKNFAVRAWNNWC